MKKAVVTGASGFVGKALTRALLQEAVQVYAVVRNPEKLADLAGTPGLIVVVADFAAYRKLPELIGDDVDTFFHLAWDGYGSHTADPLVQFENVRYAIDALQAAIHLHAGAFVFTGSCHELQKKLSAQGTWELCSVYGAAKSAFKGMGRAMAINQGIRFNSTVFSHVFGAGDYNRRSANSIILKLLRGETPALVQKEYQYDWTYIDDVTAGLLCVARQGQNLKDYYVGGTAPRPFYEIATEVRDAVAPGCPLGFGEYSDSAMIDYSMMDLEALYRDTGFCTRCTLAEGAQKTADWVQKIFK